MKKPVTLLVLGACLAYALPLQAQNGTPAGAAFAPLVQKIDEVTITVLGARWIPRTLIKQGDLPREGILPPAFFAIDFRVESTAPARGIAARRGLTPLVEAITPEGKRMRPGGLGPPVDGVHTRIWTGYDVIDPRWGSVKLEFTLRDPGAPGEEVGVFREVVEFANLPLPPADGTSLAVNRFETTPKGTRLKIESALIKGRREKPDDKRLYYIGRWLPPENIPDLCAEFGFPRGSSRNRGPDFTYDTGEPMQDRSHHNWVSPGIAIDKADETAGFFTVSASAPPPQAKSASIRLEAESRAPSLQQEKWVKRFEFNVPLNNVPLPATEKLDTTPIFESMLGETRLLLAPPRYKPRDGYKYRWEAEILLQSPRPINPDRGWVATGVRWYPEPNRNITSTGMGGQWSPWREDGTLLKPNEQVWLATPRFLNEYTPNGEPKVTFESDWEEVERSRFTLDFKNLPVPEPGKVLAPGKAYTVGELGQFVVRKIGYFDEANVLTRRIASRYARLQPAYGLVVAIEYVPAAGIKSPVWGQTLHARTWDFGDATARDASGRSLKRTCDVSDGRGGPTLDDLDPTAPPVDLPFQELNKAAAAMKGNFLTLYLLPPAPGAKTFDLQLEASHKNILRKQTVKWVDIPLPPAPATQ